MANSFDVNLLSAEIGALSNAVTPILYLPAAGGGITILSAAVVGRTDATTSLQLVNLGAAGTAVAGTICTFAGTLTAKVPAAGSIAAASAFVDDGVYLGIKEANAGAAPAVTNVMIAYVMGK